MKKKVKLKMFEKIYQPKPHPMQHRINAVLAVPSLVTGGKQANTQESKK